MTVSGTLTVARLELLQRARGARWYLALGAWVVLIGGITLLTWLGLSDTEVDAGGITFDVVVFFVLGFGMLIMPALTATSVNGDREHGVLATLQTTLLTPLDIALGKLAASFVISMAFLAAAVPFVLIAFLQGGVDLLGAARVVLVMAAMLLVVCAIGLMFSSLVARPVGSAVLTYLTVAGLTFLTTITFFMSLLLVSGREEVTVYGVEGYPSDGPTPTCSQYQDYQQVVHSERVWWLLALNPFVVVGDAAPAPTSEDEDGMGPSFAPLHLISLGAREAKDGPDAVVDQCWAQGSAEFEDDDAAAGPVWPYGLALYLLAGAGAVTVATRRVTTPVRRLPSGTRIA